VVKSLAHYLQPFLRQPGSPNTRRLVAKGRRPANAGKLVNHSKSKSVTAITGKDETRAMSKHWEEAEPVMRLEAA
jgi:hypothetical protein